MIPTIGITRSGGGSEGNIIFVNDFFCAISEYSREELLGQNHRILKSGKQPDGLFKGMWKAISSGLTWQGEILNISKTGKLYWVETTIMPFKNKEGRWTGFSWYELFIGCSEGESPGKG